VHKLTMEMVGTVDDNLFLDFCSYLC
jgi:hypothetical protein